MSDPIKFDFNKDEFTHRIKKLDITLLTTLNNKLILFAGVDLPDPEWIEKIDKEGKSAISLLGSDVFVGPLCRERFPEEYLRLKGIIDHQEPPYPLSCDESSPTCQE